MNLTSHLPIYFFLIALILDVSHDHSLAFDKQNYLLTLGRITEFKTPTNTIGILTGDFNGDKITEIATYGGSQIRFGLYENDSILYPSSILWSKRKIISAVAAKINRDNITDIILITENPLTIEVFLGKRIGTHYLAWEKEIIEPFEKILIADFNNDKKSDIILYGKNQIGATILIGNGNGSFRIPMIVFPEYSFSYMNVIDIHDDIINDIIAVNWISNEVLIFSGFGKMTFSDPSNFRFPSEPTLLTITNIDSEPAKDLIVSIPDEKKCQTYLNDGFGSFYPHQIINLKEMLTILDAADINADGKNDLAILSSLNDNLTVILNDGDGMFVEEIPFHTGQAPTTFNFYLPSINNHPHIATLDTVYDRLRIFHNAKCPFTSFKVQKFSCGIKPASIISYDIDRDGWNDILIGNNGSKTLSLYKNYGDGNFAGMISFQLPFQLYKLNNFSKDETTAVIISSIPEENKIGVVELNPYSLSYQKYHFLTQGETDILHVQENESKDRRLDIFTLEREKKTHQGTIIKYEQISNNKFVQRFYPLDTSYSVITASIGNLDEGKDKQVVYVAFDRKNKIEHLFQTSLSASQISLHRYKLYSFDTSEPVSALLQTVDLNNDNLNDIILYLEGADNSFNIFTGQKDTVQPFSESSVMLNISTSSVQNLKMKNVDDDDILDLVYVDNITRTINVCLGKGDATFTSPIRIATAGTSSDFDFADLNEDGTAELIITNASEGFLEIIFPHKAE